MMLVIICTDFMLERILREPAVPLPLTRDSHDHAGHGYGPVERVVSEYCTLTMIYGNATEHCRVSDLLGFKLIASRRGHALRAS